MLSQCEKKVNFQNEKNKKRTLSGLSETSRPLLQIFGENEIVFESNKCSKISKQKKSRFILKNTKKL